jgi:small subunit ribosomal protein S4
MGDPKKQRKKYSGPAHPWRKERIDEETQLVQEYGFKNKKEIWKHVSFLRFATAQAKKLVTLSGKQADKERGQLLERLKRYGLLSAESELDGILAIPLRDVLERRLQTVVYKKALANTVVQARQFITHKHICIGQKVVTSPSYLVPLNEEGLISFRVTSSFFDEEHPERVAAKTKKEKAVVENKEDMKDGKPGASDKKDRRDRRPDKRFDKRKDSGKKEYKESKKEKIKSDAKPAKGKK